MAKVGWSGGYPSFQLSEFPSTWIDSPYTLTLKVSPLALSRYRFNDTLRSSFFCRLTLRTLQRNSPKKVSYDIRFKLTAYKCQRFAKRFKKVSESLVFSGFINKEE